MSIFWLFWQLIGVAIGLVMCGAILASIVGCVAAMATICCHLSTLFAGKPALVAPVPESQPAHKVPIGLFWDKRTRTLYLTAPPLDLSSTRERLLRA
jgi:hypothetical protein